jgi:hypothetical protein
MRGLLINISSSLFNIFGFTNNQSVLPIHSRMSVCKFYKLRIKQRWSCVRRLSVFSEHQLQHSVSCFILVRVHMFTGSVLCAACLSPMFAMGADVLSGGVSPPSAATNGCLSVTSPMPASCFACVCNACLCARSDQCVPNA